MSGKDDESAISKIKRPTIRMTPEMYERARFWAERDAERFGEPVNFNDFVLGAVENEIARRSGLEVGADNIIVGRINQLSDAVKSMESQLAAVNTMMTTTFSTLIELARGDSVLTDAPVTETGELGDGR